MRLFAFAVVLFSSMLLSGVNGSTVHADEIKKEKQGKPNIVLVEPGDSLTKVAKRHKTSYPRIFYANKQIKDPDIIYPGDKLRIPEKNEKLAKRPLGNEAPVQTSGSTTAAKPAPKQPPTYSGGNGVWDRLASCESGGNWSINTGNGYYGGLQFSASSWRAVGGSGLPHQASKAEQIERAQMLQARQGWGAWPACTAKLGIR